MGITPRPRDCQFGGDELMDGRYVEIVCVAPMTSASSQLFLFTRYTRHDNPPSHLRHHGKEAEISHGKNFVCIPPRLCGDCASGELWVSVSPCLPRTVSSGSKNLGHSNLLQRATAAAGVVGCCRQAGNGARPM